MLLCMFLLFVLLSCQRRQEAGSSGDPNRVTSKSAAIVSPDLTRCKAIEVQYLPSIPELFFSASQMSNLLSTEEEQYIRTLRIITVTGAEPIKEFAHEMAVGSYSGTGGAIGALPIARVTCRSGGGSVQLLTVFEPVIVTNDGHWFKYSGPDYGKWRGPLMGTLLRLTPQILPFANRSSCASNLSTLRAYIRSYHRTKRTYPQADIWCDAIAEAEQIGRLGNAHVTSFFQCPGRPEAKSSYAMNPDCGADSPPDTVLLFETKPGWNQHGGPELFTFDNHDPKGGSVWLNDGTVKFIRTEKELKQLRWK